MKRDLLYLTAGLLIGIVFVGAGSIYFSRVQEQNPPPVIQSFDECVAAGYPVLESYPEQCKTPDGKSFVQNIGNELEKQELIRVSRPRPNQIISSPLVVEGEARGYWFFEADFPVRVFDSDGNELGVGIAQAQQEWMTEDFVLFRGEIEFLAPTTPTGRIVFEKDDPSGLPEHQDSVYFPIVFQ
jgi:hypothetical protein